MKRISLVIVTIIIISLFTSCLTAKEKEELARNKSLEETYWLLKAIDGNPIPDSFVTPNITFDGNGHFTGNLGCNRFGGTYFSNKEHISMGFEGATKRLCDNMRTEKMFKSALQRDIKTYSIHIDTLRMKDKQGEVMLFIAGERPLQRESSEE